MKLVLAAAVVLILAFLTAEHRWRPAALGGAFLLRVGFPSVFSGTIFAGLHVSTLLVLAYALVWPLAAPRSESNGEKRLPQIPLLCHVALVTVAVGTVMMSGSTATAMYAATLTLNQLVGPYIFCMLIYSTSYRSQSLYRDAGKLFAVVCVAEALIAIAVSSGTVAQPFQSSFATIDYWSSLGTRQAATLDHPLFLGMLLCAGLPMLAYFNSSLVVFFSASIMVTGIALTQSRIAASLAAIGIIYLLAFGIRSNIRRFGVMAIGAVGFVSALNLGIFKDLLGRFADDQGSSLVRTQSWQFFLDTWNDFLVVGVGMEDSKGYFLQNGFRASGESAAVAYAVGIGIPLTLLYFSLMVWMIGYGIRKSGRLTPASLAALVAVISIQLFSSISTESAGGMVLWAAIGISLASPRSAPVSAGLGAKRDRIGGARTLHRNVPVATRPPAADASHHPAGTGAGGFPRSRGS